MLTSLYRAIYFYTLEMPCLLQVRKLFGSCKSVSLDRAVSDLTVKPYILSD